MLWPAEYDPSGRFKRGSQIAKLLDHAKIPYVACGDLMDGHYEIEHLATVRQTNHIIHRERK